MRTTPYTFRILMAAATLAAMGVSSQAALRDDFVAQPWSLSLGGGYSPVVGGYNNTISDGWNFTVGTQYKFTEKLAVSLEYMNNHLGVDDGVLNNYSTMLGGASTEGSVNIWSVTLNPKWHFHLNHTVGGYLIGGGGYYHVRAQVTTPGLAFMPPYCDYYWGCWPGGVVPADRIIGERKDDTGGVNAGMGMTFTINSDVEFYLETRYHYILAHGPDLQLFPITAGFRFS